VLLLHAEAARKDHWQMMAHHVVTISLIVASYYYGFTRVGCLIMVIMDWCDIFLPVKHQSYGYPNRMLTHHPKLAKMLRYLSYQIACDVTFVWWMLSWFVTRHVLFCKVIATTYLDLPRQVEFGWKPDRGYSLTKEIHNIFVILLVILEVSAHIHPQSIP
jgi:acyl-CoA-dependent ceramide synthase